MGSSLLSIMRLVQRSLPLRAVLGVALLVCVAGTSCTSNRARGPASQSQRRASVQPQQPGEVERLTASHPMLKQAWEAYRTNEGDQKRASHFQQVALRLDQTCFSGLITQTRTLPADRATETEVLSFLGLPEYRAHDVEGNYYHYSYWRADTNSRWIAIVKTKSGKLELIGFTPLELLDRSNLRRVEKWSDVLANAK